MSEVLRTSGRIVRTDQEIIYIPDGAAMILQKTDAVIRIEAATANPHPYPCPVCDGAERDRRNEGGAK